MSATTDLKSTTAITPATKPKLVIDATLPNATSVKAQADRAFADNTKGAELLGTAQQRMAYAVQCEMALLLAAGSNSIPADIRAALQNTSDKSAIQARMVDIFVGDKPDTKEMPDDKTARVDMEHAKRVQLVRRGVQIAAVLSQRNVSYAMFNAKIGVYSVWSNMLYNADKGETPLGRLAATETVLLDGRPFMFSAKLKGGGEKSKGANASVTHMMSICAPSGAQRAGSRSKGDKPEAKEKGAINVNSAKSIANHVSLKVALGAFYELFITDKPSTPMTRDSMSDEMHNQLTKIILYYTEMKNAPTWNAKPVAKRTARGH